MKAESLVINSAG